MIASQTKIAAVVIAGGQSNRMGIDKATIVWQGETLLEKTARCCREARLSPVVIVGRGRPKEWSGTECFVSDEVPQSGPLGGLASGLRKLEALHFIGGPETTAATTLYALALPCDMPLIDTAALLWLKEVAKDCARRQLLGAVAITPDQQMQPLFAVYSTNLLPTIDSRLNFGRRSIVGLIESEKLPLIPVPQDTADTLRSVNTPRELDQLEQAVARVESAAE